MGWTDSDGNYSPDIGRVYNPTTGRMDGYVWEDVIPLGDGRVLILDESGNKHYKSSDSYRQF